MDMDIDFDRAINNSKMLKVDHGKKRSNLVYVLFKAQLDILLQETCLKEKEKEQKKKEITIIHIVQMDICGRIQLAHSFKANTSSQTSLIFSFSCS